MCREEASSADDNAAGPGVVRTWFDDEFDAGGTRAADDVGRGAVVDARVRRTDAAYRQTRRVPAIDKRPR